jgi:hypothetical protein
MKEAGIAGDVGFATGYVLRFSNGVVAPRRHRHHRRPGSGGCTSDAAGKCTEGC